MKSGIWGNPKCRFSSMLHLDQIHRNRRIASCPIGNGALFLAGLRLAGAIGGAGEQRVVSTGSWLPLVGPEHPAILGERRSKLRVVPGCAVIGADLDPLDAAIASEGDAADFDRGLESYTTMRAINARHRV